MVAEPHRPFVHAHSAKPKATIQGILNHYVRDQPGGLDFACYALTTRLRGADKRKHHDLDFAAEATNTQLGALLDKFGCTNRTAEEQVSRWKKLLHKIHKHLHDLDESFVTTGQGENVRVVFDVDLGGFFYTRTSSHAVVFGASLDQDQVNNGSCDEEMRRIVAEIEAAFTTHGA